jgi:hypothetical protein
LPKIMSDREHDSVGTGILPVLYGQERCLSHQAMSKLSMCSRDLNQTKLLSTAISVRPVLQCRDAVMIRGKC